jgi:hypothetical protein
MFIMPDNIMTEQVLFCDNHIRNMAEIKKYFYLCYTGSHGKFSPRQISFNQVPLPLYGIGNAGCFDPWHGNLPSTA